MFHNWKTTLLGLLAALGMAAAEVQKSGPAAAFDPTHLVSYLAVAGIGMSAKDHDK
jgi:hypothetical protein